MKGGRSGAGSVMYVRFVCAVSCNPATYRIREEKREGRRIFGDGFGFLGEGVWGEKSEDWACVLGCFRLKSRRRRALKRWRA